METERLLLRPWRQDDGVELQLLFSDAVVRGGRRFPPDRIATIAESSVRQWRVNGFGPWAAIEKATGSWIGRVGLDELDDWPGPDRIEVGFELHAAWWGRGLATESARAALAFGFEQHGLDRIISVTAAAHTAARRVMEKAEPSTERRGKRGRGMRRRGDGSRIASSARPDAERKAFKSRAARHVTARRIGQVLVQR